MKIKTELKGFLVFAAFAIPVPFLVWLYAFGYIGLFLALLGTSISALGYAICYK